MWIHTHTHPLELNIFGVRQPLLWNKMVSKSLPPSSLPQTSLLLWCPQVFKRVDFFFLGTDLAIWQPPHHKHSEQPLLRDTLHILANGKTGYWWVKEERKPEWSEFSWKFKKYCSDSVCLSFSHTLRHLESLQRFPYWVQQSVLHSSAIPLLMRELYAHLKASTHTPGLPNRVQVNK